MQEQISSGDGLRPVSAIDGPGEKLGKLRKQNDWQIDEVARALRLTVAQVHELEKDDYSQMAGATYVRGYLRGYARLLDTSVDEEINASDVLTDHNPSDILLTDKADQAKGIGASGIVSVVLIASAVVGGYYYWGQQKSPLEAQVGLTRITPESEQTVIVAENDAPTDDKTDDALALETDDPPDGRQNSVAGASEITQEPPQQTSPVSLDDARVLELAAASDAENILLLDETVELPPFISDTIEASEQGQAGSVSVEQVPAEVQVPGEDQQVVSVQTDETPPQTESATVVEESVVDESDSDESIDQNSVENEQPVTETETVALAAELETAGFDLNIPNAEDEAQSIQDNAVSEQQASVDTASTKTLTPNINDRRRLVMYFDDESWADVRDRDDHKLLYQTVTRGRVILLEGEPPFQVFLGNAKAVRVQYNGQFTEFTQHVSGLFARFTVGPN